MALGGSPWKDWDPLLPSWIDSPKLPDRYRARGTTAHSWRPDRASNTLGLGPRTQGSLAWGHTALS